jgi:hypothetical protein
MTHRNPGEPLGLMIAVDEAMPVLTALSERRFRLATARDAAHELGATHEAARLEEERKKLDAVIDRLAVDMRAGGLLR